MTTSQHKSNHIKLSNPTEFAKAMNLSLTNVNKKKPKKKEDKKRS